MGIDSARSDSRRARHRAIPAPAGPGVHPGADYEYSIAAYADEPDICTIFPRSIATRDLVTTWITAERDDLVDLSMHR